VWLALNSGLIGKTFILGKVGDGQQIALTDGSRTSCAPRQIAEVWWQPIFCLQPLTRVGDNIDQPNWTLTDLRRQFGNVVVRYLRRCISDMIGIDRCEAGGFIIWYGIHHGLFPVIGWPY